LVTFAGTLPPVGQFLASPTSGKLSDQVSDGHK
jgi:hypothetical protein